MDSRLIRWNTARVISAQLDNLRFFKNYELINKDLYDVYMHLVDFVDSNYNGNARITAGSELYNSLVTHLDNMIDFQLMIESADKSIDLGKEATARFQNAHVRSIQSVDSQMIARLNILLEYSKSVRILFNNLVPLTREGEKVSMEFSNEIEEILMNKGLDHFTVPEDLLIKAETPEPTPKEEV